MIIAAAIFQEGVICSMPQPARHHDIIQGLVRMGLPTPIRGLQGFLTYTGDFLDRTDAAKVALDGGQITKLMAPPQLYTEDLW